MTIFRDFCGTFLEFICFSCIMKSYMQISLRPQKIDYIICILVSLTVATSSILSELFSVPTGQIILLFYCFLLQKDTLINRLLCFSLSYTTMLFFQLFLVFLSILLPIDYNSIYTYMIGNILTLFTIVIAFHFTSLYKLYTFTKTTRLPFRIILIDSYLILIAFLFHSKINMQLFSKQIYYAVLFAAFILIANACILYYDQKLYAEHKAVLSYQQNLPIYESLIQQIRANQHEYTNRIQTLQSLPHTCKDYESICRALKESTENYQNSIQTYPLLQINMPVLASALFNQYTHAEKQNIKITFDIGTADLQSHAPEYQLADYACILTENAIEASKPGYHLYARLTSHNGKVHFEIRNPIEKLFQTEELSKFFHRGYTTKNQKKADGSEHGLGLYYLHHDIEKYHGTIGIDQLTHENETWIIFYIDV